MGLGAILLWSITIALTRSLSEQVGALSAGCAVYLSAGVLLAGVHLVRGPSPRSVLGLPRLFLLGCGVLFVAYGILLFLALSTARDRIQAVEVGLLNYLWPAFTLLFSVPILGNRARPGFLPGTLMALAGVWLVMTHDSPTSWRAFEESVTGDPWPYALGLLAAVTWALYSNLSRRWGTPESGGGVQLFLLATGAAFGLLRLAHVKGGAWTATAATEVAILAVATSMAYLFWDEAMRRGDLVFVAACSYFTPLLATAVSCVLLEVAPGLTLWLGCLCVMAGSFVSWRSIVPPEEEHPGRPPTGVSP
jgi:drug/metabolite transporter (DMT)-like permease